MKIAILVKQVPDTEIVPKVKADKSGVSTENINKFVINPYDEYAITLAVELSKKVTGSSTTVITVGTDKAQESIRKALAMGCDNGILLKVAEDALDGNTTSRLIYENIKDKGFDLILAGKKSVDQDQGIVGPIVGSSMGIPVVTAVQSFQLGGDNNSAVVEREIEEGTEVLNITFPALLSCEKGLNDPKPPSLPNIMQAKKKPLEIIEANVGNVSLKITKVEEPPVRSGVKMIMGEIEEQAKAVAKLLKDELKVI